MRSWGASLGTGGWVRARCARVATHHRPHEDGGEEHASRADGLRVDGRAAVEGAERAHEDDGDRVVEDGLAKDECVDDRIGIDGAHD